MCTGDETSTVSTAAELQPVAFSLAWLFRFDFCVCSLRFHSHVACATIVSVIITIS